MGVRRAPGAGKLIALPLIISGLFAPAARAQISDTIHPYVSAGYAYDDNLLRRDNTNNADAAQSDTYTTLIAGVALERPIGRQRVTASARASKVAFNRFTELDYTGKDAAAEWKWQVGNQLSGHLGASYSESLASFADFQSTARNIRTDNKRYVDANYLLHPSWQVHAGYTNERFGFDLPSQSYNNRTEKTVETGFDYIASSGSTFGLVFRQLEGVYPTQGLNQVTGLPVDNGYKQDEVKFNVNWIASGVTQVTFLGGWVNRRHNTEKLRDDSGANGRLIVNWSPLGHTQFNGMIWREFGAAEGTLVNSALSTGASAGASWSPTAKLSYNANVKYEKRDFEPLSGVSGLGGLTDNSRTASVGVTYQAWRQVSLNLNGFTTRRDGSAAAATSSFRAKGVSFNATVKF
ncbi:exopolysaccharide biosynthesis operon protein EpsL [Duganella sp. CF517]|nr:exopolysaccharide biosynthesis operon protein EpsL [Duganella sp. CF517]